MVLASDVPHVSFLGFGALLGRIDAESIAVEPTLRSSWGVFDRSGVERATVSVATESTEKTTAMVVEAESTGTDGDRWVTRADVVTEREAPFGLRDWWLEAYATDRHRQLRPSTRMVERGAIVRGRVRWSGVVRPEPTVGRQPTCVSWAWTRLAEHDAETQGPPIRVLHVLDGLSCFAPDVRWQACGRVVWNGAELRGFRVFGPSYPVRHIWVGPGGAALFELGLDRALVRHGLLEGGR